MSKYKGVDFIQLWLEGGTTVSKATGVTELQNVAGALTPIIRLQPPKYRRWWILEAPIFAKLIDANGDELRPETQLVAMFKGADPYQDNVKIGDLSYAVHHQLDWKAQLGIGAEHPAANWPALSLSLSPVSAHPSLASRFQVLGENLRSFRVEPGERLEFCVRSNQIVDWANEGSKVLIWIHEEPIQA